jgi:hypothetical protein
MAEERSCKDCKRSGICKDFIELGPLQVVFMYAHCEDWQSKKG